MEPLNVIFALVSVRKGRAKIRKAIEDDQDIPITLKGTLVGVWSRDDGVDQEFEMLVESATASKPRKRKAA